MFIFIYYWPFKKTTARDHQYIDKIKKALKVWPLIPEHFPAGLGKKSNQSENINHGD